MAYEIPGFSASFPAAAAIAQADVFKFVKYNSSKQVLLCTAVTDIPVGVVQTPATNAGDAVKVMMFGISKVQGDANLANGDLIGTSADGQAAAYVAGTDTTKYIVGQVLEDNTTAGGLVTASINCVAPSRGA
jgi:hypothetical protein